MTTENLNETLHKKTIDCTSILNIHNAVKFLDSNKKTVIITGVTGQDGSFMSDYLLQNTDHIIFGGVRRLSVHNHKNISHIKSDRYHLINFDLTDSHSISQIIDKLKPDYFINFAAQSFVASSWDFARQTWECNSTAILDILEAVRLYNPTCRVYNAGSSEEFGNVIYSPQNEEHPLRPRSPYAASKAAARQLIKVYRESYNLYAVQGWLFNHEGTRRGEEFVTRKITKGIAKIKKAIMDVKPFEPLELGNIDAKRDWSDAEDFIDAVWKMLNQEKYNVNLKFFSPSPLSKELLRDKEFLVKNLKDYVVSSGENHSIREFVDLAFYNSGIKGKWKGDGLNSIFESGDQILVKINPNFYRPAEVDALVGDSSKIKNDLGWQPKTTFNQLIKKMVDNDRDLCYGYIK